MEMLCNSGTSYRNGTELTALWDVFNQPLETTLTIEKCTTSGGRTLKEANESSFVFVHQLGGDDVT